MRVLSYEGLDTAGLEVQLARVTEALERDDFRAAQMKKLGRGDFYRAELGRKDRLLIQLRRHQGQGVALLLEVIRQHAYEKSRFLGGASIDETRIPDLDPRELDAAPELPHLPKESRHFRLLDKVLLWDEAQDAAFHAELPMLLIGSAGSGKTALVLEKIKEQTGRILYATLSPYLAEHARRLYHAHGFAREDQEVDFLSFREFLETIRVPQGREASYRDFQAFFQRHARAVPDLDAHRIHEEFKGVLTGFSVEKPWLDREDYLGLGIRQSIFPEDLRPKVYGLFEKYLDFLKESGLFEPNILAHGHLAHCEASYDMVAIDEVQDITNVQLALLLRSLKKAGRFILCGDANQVVHPNFFSWSSLKTYFFQHREMLTKDITRILQANYRNTPQVTGLANRLLRLKQRRFGSIDKESHFLVESAATAQGDVVCLKDSDGVRRELDKKTSQSAHFAVIVMRDEDKAEAAARFKTPLLFSIHEAKGLEYENVILLNFTSNQRSIFKEIAQDLTAADLEGEFQFGRAKDKGDRSLETYKFFVNSLYVAMTRAVKNLYWLEQDPSHPFLSLMGFGTQERSLQLAEQKSSAEDWEREARRLEMQGKLEQAQAIQKTLLRHRPVPWTVLDAAGLADAVSKALPAKSVSAKQRERLFEWALVSCEPMTLSALHVHGYPAPNQAIKQRDRVLAKLTAPYRAAQNRDLWRDVETHGLSFRNPYNLTPLMLAARSGNVTLTENLLERGADPELLDTRGWSAYHHALDEAWRVPDFAHRHFGPLSRLLAPESLSLESEGRLLKLDQRQMETFLIHAFRVLLPWSFPMDDETGDWPGLSAPELVKRFEQLPFEVLPEYRQKRAYVSSLLSRHERARVVNGGRPLFWRTRRGLYTLDPKLKLRLGEAFHPVHDLLFPSVLRPFGSRAIQEFLESPDTFQPPHQQYLDKLRAQWQAEEDERALRQANIQAEQAQWRKDFQVRQAQWEAENKRAKEGKEAARKARALKREQAARQAEMQSQSRPFGEDET